MFSKLSLKAKIIIFSIAAMAGIGIIIYNGINNWKQAQQLKTIDSTPKISSSNETINASSNNNEKVDTQKQQNEEVARIEEQQKQLEQKYQEAFTDFHSKKYQEAINISDEIIKTDNSFYKAYSIKGITLCYSSNYIEGMKNIDKALELKNDYGYGLFNKALALELYAHYDEALVWYDKDLGVENYIWSYYGKASIYGRKGDVPNAVKNLKVAIDMDSNVKDLAKQEPDFNNVRNSKEFQQLLQ